MTGDFPPLPYGRQWIDDDDVAAVVECLRGDWLTQGPRVDRFEQALCEATGANYAVAVSSGTAALHLAALAAGVLRGDWGVTAAVTFVASANCSYMIARSSTLFITCPMITVNCWTMIERR